MATDYVINTDRMQNFFNQLETRKSLLETITELHKNITHHFTSLEQSLAQKSQTLDSRIEAFEIESKRKLESLENRENSIPERESVAAAKVEEQKESAVSEIESAKGGGERNWLELLKLFCRRMDSGALVRLLLAKRKESVAMKAEIAAAMEESVDSMRLVLDAVEEFVEAKVEGKGGVADKRWVVGILIQAVVPVEETGGGVGATLRERAAGVLEKWKGAVAVGEGHGIGAGEASMFLQLVVGFGLKGKIDEEFLRKLVVEFAGRRDMAKLAVALGFGDKLRDIIDGFVKSGKEIEAVYFASESGLTEPFPPVTLLKTYLKNCRKNASNISKNGNHNTSAVEEANKSELIATRAIIKCVEDHKLESQFPLDNLRKRLSQLEKTKSEKKRTASSTSKPLTKRAHGGGGRGAGTPAFRPPKARRFSNPSPSFVHRNPPPTHQTSAAARYSGPYNYPSQSVYEGPGALYGSRYSSESPAAPLPQQYSYPPEDVAPTGVRAGVAYGGPGAYVAQTTYSSQTNYSAPTNYSAYDYGAAGVPSYPTSYPQ